MESRHLRRRAAAQRIAFALVCVLFSLALASPALGAGTESGGYARVRPACPAPGPGEATCFALGRVPAPAGEAAAAGVHRVPAHPSALTLGPAGGLTPSLLASAYGYSPGAGGSGETVAIVDAFDDPNIEADLAKYNEQYGLPACTTENGCFRKVGQSGSASELPVADTKGWSVEISLDVEMVHAACPKCRILLVESKNASLANLGAAVTKAVEMGAAVVSNSYGGPEEALHPLGAPERALFEHPGVVITAATGDFGYLWWAGPPPFPQTTNMPASMPGVVSVGGTTLNLNGEGKRSAESVWNGNGPLNEGEWQFGVSGGGCSIFFEATAWQHAAPGFPATGCGTKRLSADVSAVGDPLTGFDIFDTYECGSPCSSLKGGKAWSTIGGTSVSTPLIGALYALAGGADGISTPSLTLYAHLGGSSLFDVTKGGNGYCDDEGKACGVNAKFNESLDCEGTTSCNAVAGYDGPSGVGAPAALSAFEPPPLKAAIAPPEKLIAGTAATFGSAGSSDPYPGATRAFSWTFGDGKNGTGATVEHTYAAAGEYTVTLTTSDSYGLQSAPATIKVTVTGRTKEEVEKEAKEKKEKEEQEALKAKEAKEKKEKEEQEALKAKEAKEKKEKEEQELKAKEAKERKEKEEAGNSELEKLKKAFEEAAARMTSGPSTGQASSGQGGTAGFKAEKAAVPDATLHGTRLRAGRGGSFVVQVACPAGESFCEGSLTVRTLSAVIAGSGGHAHASVLTLASGNFKIAGGQVASVRLHLTGRARALLNRKGTLRVRVVILAHDPAGASHTSHATATLYGSRRHG
jgi:hypothetical protein